MAKRDTLDDILDDLFLCSIELSMFLGDKPAQMSAKKIREMEKLLGSCQDAKEQALDAGATKAQIKLVLDDADVTAGMLEDIADSGMKITIEL